MSALRETTATIRDLAIDIARLVGRLLLLAVLAVGIGIEAVMRWTAARIARRTDRRPEAIASALVALPLALGGYAAGRTASAAMIEARAIELVRMTTGEYVGLSDDAPDAEPLPPIPMEPGEPETAAPSPHRCDDVPASIMPDAVRQWCEEIDAAADRYGLDPRALAIIATIECPQGDPACGARGSALYNPVGARGGFQLMPGTAIEIAAATGLACTDGPEGVTLDYATNAKCGAWYLTQRLRDAAPVWHAGDETAHVAIAGAGYNGGPGRAATAMRHWQNGGHPCEAAIPEETRRYCRMVYDSWQLLQASPPSGPTESDAQAMTEPGPSAVGSPVFALPWPVGETWRYSGGPGGSHTPWNPEAGGAALDFAPPDSRGCAPSSRWATAIEAGTVLDAAAVLYWPPDDGTPGWRPVDVTGTVVVDHGDGWESLYSHMTDAAAIGTRVEKGGRIGRPSCLGGFATGAHVHLGIRHDGRWIEADEIELAGWRVAGGAEDWTGTASHPEHGERAAFGPDGLIEHEPPSAAGGE